MTKYLVDWDVNLTRQIECPDLKPDPYTGELPMTSCLVDHTEGYVRHMAKSFDTQQEAIDFIEAAPGRSVAFNFSVTNYDDSYVDMP